MSGLIQPYRFAAAGGSNPYSTEVLADSPILYWKFDETTGTSAADSSGNSHPGTIAGSPTLGATKVMPAGASAFTLNSTAKTVQCSAASAGANSSYTVEAWIRLTNVTSYHNVFNRDGNFGSRGWNLYITDGKLNVYDNGADHAGATTMSTGTVYYVAATYDGTTAKAYLNGVQDLSTSISPSGAPTTNPFIVGASNAGTGSLNFALTGEIDHVALYGTVLSSTRIAAHYAAASVGP